MRFQNAESIVEHVVQLRWVTARDLCEVKVCRKYPRAALKSTPVFRVDDLVRSTLHAVEFGHEVNRAKVSSRDHVLIHCLEARVNT